MSKAENHKINNKINKIHSIARTIYRSVNGVLFNYRFTNWCTIPGLIAYNSTEVSYPNFYGNFNYKNKIMSHRKIYNTAFDPENFVPKLVSNFSIFPCLTFSKAKITKIKDNHPAEYLTVFFVKEKYQITHDGTSGDPNYANSVTHDTITHVLVHNSQVANWERGVPIATYATLHNRKSAYVLNKINSHDKTPAGDDR